MGGQNRIHAPQQEMQMTPQMMRMQMNMGPNGSGHSSSQMPPWATRQSIHPISRPSNIIPRYAMNPVPYADMQCMSMPNGTIRFTGSQPGQQYL